MKHITCKQMGGPCDAFFVGDTPVDIMKAAEKHITEMATSDPAHQKTYDEMAAIASDEREHEKWKKSFQKMWEDAPDNSHAKA